MRLEELVGRLQEDGLLLLADARRPSVASLVAGAPIKGSWWGHPKGREIFALSQALADHRDVLVAKLVDGKVTFVHRRLWPAVLAVARAREPWQTQGLSPVARRLLARVDAESQVEASGAAAKELETRLLVHSEEVHTQSGKHKLVLSTWDGWAKRHGPLGRPLPLARAKDRLEAVDPAATFGWQG